MSCSDVHIRKNGRPMPPARFMEAALAAGGPQGTRGCTQGGWPSDPSGAWDGPRRPRRAPVCGKQDLFSRLGDRFFSILVPFQIRGNFRTSLTQRGANSFLGFDQYSYTRARSITRNKRAYVLYSKLVSSVAFLAPTVSSEKRSVRSRIGSDRYSTVSAPKAPSENRSVLDRIRTDDVVREAIR